MENTYSSDGRFTTVEEQIKKLENYGISINNKEFAGNVLKSTSYYYLIDVYSEIFKIDGKRRDFLPFTTFEEFYSAYMFDIGLKFLITSFLKPIELHIKTLIAYYFSKTFSHRSSEYLSSGKYYNPSIVDILEAKLTQDDYLKEKDNAPMWVIVNRLTFGETAQLFKALKHELQNQICAEFRTFTTREFECILDALVALRNNCAHDEPLYCFVFKINCNYEKREIREIIINDPCNFYSLLKIISYLVDDNELNRLVWDLTRLIDSVVKTISPKAYTNLISRMGLQSNWIDGLHAEKEILTDYYQNIKIDTHLGTVKAINITNN